MTDSKKSFPKLCRQKGAGGSDRGYIRVKSPSGGARRHYLGPWGEITDCEYERLRALWIVAGKPDNPLPSHNGAAGVITVAEIVEKFLEWAESYYKKWGVPTGTAEKYFRAARPALKLYGTLPVSEFRLTELENVQRELDRPGKLSRYEINDRIRKIRKIFSWGKKHRLVPAGICEDLNEIESLKRGRCNARDCPPITAPPREVIDMVLAELNSVVADMVRLQIYSGMRPGEVCSLRPADLDKSGEVWVYSPPDKVAHLRSTSSAGRRVYFGRPAQKILAPYLLAAGEEDEYLFLPTDAAGEVSRERRKKRKTKVQPSQQLRDKIKRRTVLPRFTKDCYRGYIQRACKKAGVKNITPNQIRHYFGTVVKNKRGWIEASKLLGHASLNATKYYADADDDLARRIANEIEDILD